MKLLTLLLVCLVVLNNVNAYRRRKNCDPSHKDHERRYTISAQDLPETSPENSAEESQGVNKFTKATDFTLDVRIIDTTTGNEQDYEERFVKINNIGTVFIVSNHDDISSVTNSVSLLDVVNDGDDIQNGVCCGGISQITQANIYLSSSESVSSNDSTTGDATYFCVTLNAKTQIWNLCNQNPVVVEEFKQNIRTWIVINYFKSHDLPQPHIIPDPLPPTITNYNIDEQDYWPTTCTKGLFQSPIDLSLEKTQEGNVYESIKLDYGLNGNAQPVWNGLNYVVNGDFGTFTHTWEYGQREYNANSLTFKFPSEHTLNGEPEHGELQVSHTSADGKTLVVSFFLTTDGSGAEGKFFTDLNVDVWEQEGTQPITGLNLNQLLPDGKTVSYDLNKSYYQYRGSLTVPPCTEGVEHFVLQNAVYVPKQTLETISSKVLVQGSSSNNRQVNTGFADLVLYVKQEDECAQGIPDSIKDLLEEQKRALERQASKEQAEDEEGTESNSNEPQTHIDGHIVKTTEDVVQLQYDTADNSEEAEKEGVDLSNLSSTEKAQLRNGGTIQGDFDIPEEQVENELIGKGSSNKPQEITGQAEYVEPQNDDEEEEQEQTPEEQIQAVVEEEAGSEALPELHPTRKHKMRKLMRHRRK